MHGRVGEVGRGGWAVEEDRSPVLFLASLRTCPRKNTCGLVFGDTPLFNHVLSLHS